MCPQSLLQAEPPLVSQLVFRAELFQASGHLHDPLDKLEKVYVLHMGRTCGLTPASNTS